MGEDEPNAPSGPARFASEVRDLMQACRSATSPKALLGNCEKLFRLLRDKKLEIGVPFVSTPLSPGSARGGDGKEEFVKWLRQSFQAFISLVFELLCSLDFQIQKLGLAYLHRIIKHEGKIHQSAAFPLAAYQVLIAKLLQSECLSPQLQDALITEYAGKFADLRYYLFVVVGKILREFVHQKTGERRPCGSAAKEEQDPPTSDTEQPTAELHATESRGPEWFVWTKGQKELSRRFTSLLLRLSKTFINDGEMGALRKKRKAAALPEREDGDDSDGEVEGSIPSEPRLKTYVDNIGNSKAFQIGNHRLAYQNAWITLLLDVDHDKLTTQKLLSEVPRSVMPFMSNPLLLADFFLKAFRDANNLSISIAALSGMFYLVVKHGLGTPDGCFDETEGAEFVSKETESAGVHFYQRLYRLLTPAALAPRLRVRFLRLLNVALRSDLLPTCLVALFIKKCIRVACLVSPAAALCLQALALSLLQKYHATCKPLLSLPEHFAARLRVAGDSFDYSTADIREGREGSSSFSSSFAEEWVENEEESNAIFALINRSIPSRLKINKTEICPLTRKEARLSLWEIDLMKTQALKSVRQLSDIFDADFGNPAAKRVCIDDFLDVTTGSLLARELKALDKPSSCSPLPALNALSVHPDVPILHNACMQIARQEA